jgi:hypothetical protein
MGRTTPGLPISWAAPLVIGLMAPHPAHALEMSGGVSLGGFQAGRVGTNGREMGGLVANGCQIPRRNAQTRFLATTGYFQR